MKNRMFWIGLAFFLSLCILMVLFLIFNVRRSPIPNPVMKPETVLDFEQNIIGEEGKAETEIDLYAYPTYTGPVSYDAVRSWLEDPANLIDDTNFTIRGNIEF